MNGSKSFQAPHVHVSNCIEISLYRVFQYILEHEMYPKSIFICLCSCNVLVLLNIPDWIIRCFCQVEFHSLRICPWRKEESPSSRASHPGQFFCGQIFHYYKGQTDLEYASHRVEKWNCGKNCVCSCFESSKSGLIRRFWVRFCFERWLEECWPSHGRASISSFQHWHVGNRKISRKMKTSLEVVHQQLETD